VLSNNVYYWIDTREPLPARDPPRAQARDIRLYPPPLLGARAAPAAPAALCGIPAHEGRIQVTDPDVGRGERDMHRKLHSHTLVRRKLG
jgi:hypothetical protein